MARVTPVDRLERLARTAGPDVLAYLARRVSPAEDAADIYSQVLTITWQKLRVVPDDDGEAFAWMLGVARKCLANHRRGAAHPLASLWDNGDDPVAMLRREMEVRRIALSQFGLATRAPRQNLQRRRHYRITGLLCTSVGFVATTPPARRTPTSTLSGSSSPGRSTAARLLACLSFFVRMLLAISAARTTGLAW